jgi:membrane protease YdiL (CAAX protease family)
MFSREQSIEFAKTLNAEDFICVCGLVLFGCWLLRTSLGAKALADVAPRRNNMPLYLPLIPLLIWFGPVPMAVLLAQELTQDVLGDWQNAFLDNCIFSAGAIVTTAVILLLARAHFARRLKGFGLNIKAVSDTCIFVLGVIVTRAGILLLARVDFVRRLKGFGGFLVYWTVAIGVVLLLARLLFAQRLRNIKAVLADFLYACVNLLAVWPLIMGAIILTQIIGERIWGQDYQMQQHQELELITEYPQLPLRIAIVIVAVIVAPVLEELLFRGLVQTTIRSVLDLRFSNFDCRFEIGNRQPAIGNRQSTLAWLAIAMSSGLFAAMHANPGHWPALFVLSVCLGYAYEKSGSLFRPIFIHAFFNTASIAAALSQS